MHPGKTEAARPVRYPLRIAHRPTGGLILHIERTNRQLSKSRVPPISPVRHRPDVCERAVRSKHVVPMAMPVTMPMTMPVPVVVVLPVTRLCRARLIGVPRIA